MNPLDSLIVLFEERTAFSGFAFVLTRPVLRNVSIIVLRIRGHTIREYGHSGSFPSFDCKRRGTTFDWGFDIFRPVHCEEVAVVL
jgi:hypothetical protein